MEAEVGWLSSFKKKKGGVAYLTPLPFLLFPAWDSTYGGWSTPDLEVTSGMAAIS